MSPGILQDSGPAAGVAPVKPSDALESVKAGLAGHNAALSGVSRSGAPQMNIPAFETTFAVPMHCTSCVSAVEAAARDVPGIESATADLETGLLLVRGTAAPSSVVSALQDAGKDAILRGSGASNSAAVCILEVDGEVSKGTSPVRGLARLLQVSPSHTLIDLTLSGLAPGTYEASIRTTGDISRGAESLGEVWQSSSRDSEVVQATRSDDLRTGNLGTIEIDEKGRGAAYIAKNMSVWEIIGRGMSILKRDSRAGIGNGVCGVLARSAGVWDNDKVVCSCSGKTVWEERKDQRERGIL